MKTGKILHYFTNKNQRDVPLRAPKEGFKDGMYQENIGIYEELLNRIVSDKQVLVGLLKNIAFWAKHT